MMCCADLNLGQTKCSESCFNKFCWRSERIIRLLKKEAKNQKEYFHLLAVIQSKQLGSMCNACGTAIANAYRTNFPVRELLLFDGGRIVGIWDYEAISENNEMKLIFLCERSSSCAELNDFEDLGELSKVSLKRFIDDILSN